MTSASWLRVPWLIVADSKLSPAANVLFKPLRQGQLTLDHLRRVQQRRELPTRVTQWLQVTVQRRIIARVLVGTGPLKPH